MTTCKSSVVVCGLSLILLVMTYRNVSINNVNLTVSNTNHITLGKKDSYMPEPHSETIPVVRCPNKFSNLEDNNRPLVRYYKYLTKHYDLGLNLPKDMLGGTSTFKAKDVIQFTFEKPNEPKISIVLVCFDSGEKQTFGVSLMKKLTSDNRKVLQVKNYALLVKGGNENVYKTLIDSLESFTAMDN